MRTVIVRFEIEDNDLVEQKLFDSLQCESFRNNGCYFKCICAFYWSIPCVFYAVAYSQSSQMESDDKQFQTSCLGCKFVCGYYDRLRSKSGSTKTWRTLQIVFWRQMGKFVPDLDAGYSNR